MKKWTFVLVVLAVSLACGRTGEPRRLELYPSPTVLPTQTERVVVWTSTPLSTYTPIVKEVTSTPKPTLYLCVSANEAVHLRPSPSVENYPIEVLPKGTRLTDLGGRKENWAFVQNGERSGWVHLKFLENCN